MYFLISRYSEICAGAVCRQTNVGIRGDSLKEHTSPDENYISEI